MQLGGFLAKDAEISKLPRHPPILGIGILSEDNGTGCVAAAPFDGDAWFAIPVKAYTSDLLDGTHDSLILHSSSGWSFESASAVPSIFHLELSSDDPS